MNVRVFSRKFENFQGPTMFFRVFKKFSKYKQRPGRGNKRENGIHGLQFHPSLYPLEFSSKIRHFTLHYSLESAEFS